MFRIYLLALGLLVSFQSESQTESLPKFEFENYSLPTALVISVKNKDEKQLKQRVQRWINSFYTDTTLLDSTEGKSEFEITGKSMRLLKIKNLPTDLKYNLKISLRNEKYRLEISSLAYKYYTEYREISDVNLIKDDIIKQDLLESRQIIASFLNTLNTNLYKSITEDYNEW